MSTLKVPVTEADHIQGSSHATVTLVEYGDYECPHCGLAYPTVKLLQKRFGKKLRFVFRNFPLRESHPNAETAAECAEFAGARGRFWEMHDGIFENQEAIGLSLFFELTEGMELSVPELNQALEAQQFEPRVRDDFRGGVRSGVNGTPTFFINGQRHDGPFELDDLVEAIERQMTTTE
jgi:protein-disulfide isomerase